MVPVNAAVAFVEVRIVVLFDGQIARRVADFVKGQIAAQVHPRVVAFATNVLLVLRYCVVMINTSGKHRQKATS